MIYKLSLIHFLPAILGTRGQKIDQRVGQCMEQVLQMKTQKLVPSHFEIPLENQDQIHNMEKEIAIESFFLYQLQLVISKL